MAVSERDQEYMRRIGDAKAASHADAAAAQRALALAERLQRSWELYLACRATIRGDRDDDPSAFYERARPRSVSTSIVIPWTTPSRRSWISSTTPGSRTS